jgi:hypothetical protein
LLYNLLAEIGNPSAKVFLDEILFGLPARNRRINIRIHPGLFFPKCKLLHEFQLYDNMIRQPLEIFRVGQSGRFNKFLDLGG